MTGILMMSPRAEVVKHRNVEAAAGIEPAIRDLQSPALPLGYAAEATRHDMKKALAGSARAHISEGLGTLVPANARATPPGGIEPAGTTERCGVQHHVRAP
jgi:hypothetical protein